MLSAYPAYFIKEEFGYSVIFPDLDNLATCGHTLDEAFMMAMDCLAGHLVWLQEDGEAIPAPSALDTISPETIAQAYNVSVQDVSIQRIVVDVAEYATTHFQGTVTTTVSIPTSLYHLALEQELDLSNVLQTALTHTLNI